ncbi:hypothetical protein KSF_070610 [Reticulibacter mediterranei]|uniref:Uncharacterized protein n=1 Tax=Reticulibacter mediterranei TaxID=2778369 RepID=A0A8J3N5Z8_9CHLR|nr:hypothetical protein [Reticulibacter mediterranei]GHO97013.1 hypothetical protein KSF_070610 [Reticulibacter mediterranei]
MTGRRSPERFTEQTSSPGHSDAGTDTQFFDVARGIVTPHKQGKNSLDLIKQMTQPQEVKRDITFGHDLIRTEAAAAQAQLAEEESAQGEELDKKKGKRPMKAAETGPEAKRTKPEQSADNQGDASRSNETRDITLKEMEQIISQADYNIKGSRLLENYYMQLDTWINNNQHINTTQEYKKVREVWQKTNTAIKDRTTDFLRETMQGLDNASRAQLEAEFERLQTWLNKHQPRRETAIYQLNEDLKKLIEGRINIKKLEEQLAKYPQQ